MNNTMRGNEEEEFRIDRTPKRTPIIEEGRRPPTDNYTRILIITLGIIGFLVLAWIIFVYVTRDDSLKVLGGMANPDTVETHVSIATDDSTSVVPVSDALPVIQEFFPTPRLETPTESYPSPPPTGWEE